MGNENINMTTTEIISLFNLFVADSTELSDTEELALLNRVIGKIALDRPWESLKTEATGTILVSGSIYYITLLSDFGFLVENKDNKKIIFVGSNHAEYEVVSFSNRRDYRDTGGYAYLDLVNNRIVFTANPSSAGSSYEFDYCKIPADVASGGTPTFPPARFHPMIAAGMSVDELMIEQFPKAQSYTIENQAKYNSYLRDLAYWNSQLQIS